MDVLYFSIENVKGPQLHHVKIVQHAFTLSKKQYRINVKVSTKCYDLPVKLNLVLSIKLNLPCVFLCNVCRWFACLFQYTRIEGTCSCWRPPGHFVFSPCNASLPGGLDALEICSWSWARTHKFHRDVQLTWNSDSIFTLRLFNLKS